MALSSSRSAAARAKSVCTISQANYDSCVEILQRQDSRIKQLEGEIKKKELQIQDLQMSAWPIERRGERHETDGPEEVKWRKECSFLQSALDRQDVDVGGKVQLSRSEEAESKLRVEIQKQNDLIKDLKFSLESEGGNAELYMEARLKNDRLTKVIDNKEHLLAGHQAHIEELEKSLREKAMLATHTVDGVCQKCLTSEGQVATLNDEIKSLRNENQNLSSSCSTLRSEQYKLQAYCEKLQIQVELGFRPSEPTTGMYAQDPSSRHTDQRSESSSYVIPVCTTCENTFETDVQLRTHTCTAGSKS